MMNQDELYKNLELHEKWIKGEDSGERADLSFVNLSGAHLSDANLEGANLSGAHLSDANLSGVIVNAHTLFFRLQCPEKGSYIGYKKSGDYRIVELLILEDAKRSSATTRKCRASKVKVLSITNIDCTKNYKEASSWFDQNFIYKVGETIEVENFEEDRWFECSEGIHHFITRDEAVNWVF